MKAICPTLLASGSLRSSIARGGVTAATAHVFATPVRPRDDPRRSRSHSLTRSDKSCRAASTRARGPSTAVDMADYGRWTKEALVRRLQELERQQASSSSSSNAAPTTSSNTTTSTTNAPPKKKPPPKSLDPSRYATRFVALKIAYLGGRYGGFEFQPSGALPTIEEELWKALVKATLVTPLPGRRTDEVDLVPFDYSKCGRTDRGVSAFGQVVALRVRSKQQLPAPQSPSDGDAPGDASKGSPEDNPSPVDSTLPPDQEIQYCKVLNRLLPPDIRVLAWCPTPPPGFSARFSCRERRYRYFFTNPAYRGAESDGRLDIAAMRTAAHHFVGVHDFRNFCKLDPKKQITNYRRRIFAADIVQVTQDGVDGNSSPALYSFDVRGSAFLWHQIRHMVAVLFLVGQGLESPSVVPALLDAEARPGRPPFAMADDTPLVLWDCLFGGRRDLEAMDIDSDGEGGDDEAAAAAAAEAPEVSPGTDTDPDHDELQWITATDEAPDSSVFIDGLWGGWHAAKMQEVLAGQLFNRTLEFVSTASKPWTPPPLKVDKTHTYEGGPLPRLTGRYVPLLQRTPLAPPEEINDKFARQQGFASAAAMREAGNWRAVIKARKAEEAAAVSYEPA